MKTLNFSISSRERILGTIIIFVLLYFLFDYIIYTPKLRLARSIEQEVEFIDQKIKESFKDFTSPLQIKHKIKDLENRQEFFEKKFSQTKNTSTHLMEIARICKKNNIEILSISPAETKKDAFQKYRDVLIEMNLRCDYKTIILFMQDIKSLPGINIVKFFKIHASAEDLSPLEFTLVLEAFFPIKNNNKHKVS